MRQLGREAEPGREMMSPGASGGRRGTRVATPDPGGDARRPSRLTGQEGLGERRGGSKGCILRWGRLPETRLD